MYHYIGVRKHGRFDARCTGVSVVMLRAPVPRRSVVVIQSLVHLDPLHVDRSSTPAAQSLMPVDGGHHPTASDADGVTSYLDAYTTASYTQSSLTEDNTCY